MRILYAARLFSGLETSVEAGVWRPTGVPTIYRMIERLSQEAEALDLVLTAKQGAQWTAPTVVIRRLEGLETPVRILPQSVPSALARTVGRGVGLEIRHAAALLSAVRRFRPDAVYIDHANIVTADLLARYSRVPTVLRLMGVYPAMRRALDSARFQDRVLRHAYRAPYAQIVMTQDGSGSEPWIKRALSPSVPCEVMLNGVAPDLASAEPRLPADLKARAGDRPVVVFLGKLEEAKGALRFAEAVIRAMDADAPPFHAVMVGTGAQRETIERTAASAGRAKDLTILARLPHAEVASLLRAASVYVSLNRLGNLSNANLEAFAAGVPAILPQSETATGVDVVTDRMVPPDGVLRVSSTDAVDEIAAAIGTLLREPQRAAAASAALSRFARSRIWTWEERIDAEIALVRRVAKTGRRQ